MMSQPSSAKAPSAASSAVKPARSKAPSAAAIPRVISSGEAPGTDKIRAMTFSCAYFSNSERKENTESSPRLTTEEYVPYF